MCLMNALAYWVRVAGVAAFWCLLSGCSQNDQPAAPSGPPLLIDPNLAVGKIHAGMTMAQVEAELGPPPRKTGDSIEYPALGLAVMAASDGVVQYVLCGDVSGINGPFVKVFNGHTKEGIGMYSTRAEVLKAYGQPTDDRKLFFSTESLRYDPLGITFTLEGGRVHHMAVRLEGEPGTNRTMQIEVAPGK